MENNFDNLIEGSAAVAPQAEYDKEAFKAERKQERDELSELAAAKLEQVFTDPAVLNSYLAMQGRMGQKTLTKTLLILAQRPDATNLKTYDDWTKSGRTVKKNQKGVKVFEPNGEYTRDDGTTGTNYKVDHLFDVAQTYGKPIQPRQQAPIRSRVKALTSGTPMPIRLSDEVTQEQAAMYSPEQDAILVARGLDGDTIFRSVARELAYAAVQNGDPKQDRFIAECAAAIVCHRYGVATPEVGQIPETIRGMDQEEKREALSDVRKTACDTMERVDLNLFAERQQQKAEQNRDAR